MFKAIYCASIGLQKKRFELVMTDASGIAVVWSSPMERHRRQGPFSGMPSGGPFHGGMGGPLSGMGSVHAGPQGMGPSMGGQSHSEASAMFNPVGSQCIRHNIVCPKWCLIEDTNGCKSCPCGPGEI